MCAKIGKMSAGTSAGIGFGLDTLGHIVGYNDERKDIARHNDAIRRQNQLAINSYDTKNRNAKLAWENDKIDGEIAVDNKWKETKDAIAEAQLQARETMGKSAIAQQQILTKMINAGAGREQAGRRSGRGGIAEKGAQWAAEGAAAAFSKNSEIMFQDKLGRNLASFAQGKYVEYITGRPSPEAPPTLESYRKGPSFLNTALKIGQSGLNRYNQYKGNMAGKDTPLLPSKNYEPISGGTYEQYTEGAFQQQPSFNYDAGQLTTMEVPSYSAPVFGGDKSLLQGEMDDYFNTKTTTNWEKSLGVDNQILFGG